MSTTLANGSPVTADHSDIDPKTGQQKGYVVLSQEDRDKGFIRTLRNVYTHIPCKTQTRMSAAIAETYAANPLFYTSTFCVKCRAHFPVGMKGEFIWSDGAKVGT